MKPGLHEVASFTRATVTGLGLLLASGAALALDCNTTIGAGDQTITLTEDIVCSEVGDTGIRVTASNVTIDLNGHTISGFKREDSVGIRVEPPFIGAIVNNVTIVNGTIAFFNRGVVIDAASGVTVTNVVAKGNRTDGIFVQDGTGIELSGNELIDNTNGIVTRYGSDIDITSNRGKGNSSYGFDVTGGTQVSLTNNESGGTQRAAFLTVGPAEVTFAANRAKGFKGFGFQFLDNPYVTDGGGNNANGKPTDACSPDACPLALK